MLLASQRLVSVHLRFYVHFPASLLASQACSSCKDQQRVLEAAV